MNIQSQLIQRARELGVPLGTPEAARLQAYLDLMLFWNKRINLTAIEDPAEIVEKHFLDSLAVLRHLPSEGATLGDFGTGAGFPGAVIAALAPAWTVTLVESNQKKVAFLRTLKRELGLSSMVVVGARDDEWPRKPGFALQDVVVSRAVWALPEWLVRAEKLVRPEGLVLGMEGAEQHPLPAGAERHPYAVAQSQRAIITWRPQRST